MLPPILCHEAAHREDKADIDLGPFLGGQVDGHKRAKAGLDVGDEEDEPIEPAQATSARTTRRFALYRLLGLVLRRRRGTVLPIPHFILV
jgi:hypothetical protein